MLTNTSNLILDTEFTAIDLLKEMVTTLLKLKVQSGLYEVTLKIQLPFQSFAKVETQLKDQLGSSINAASFKYMGFNFQITQSL